MTRHLIREPLTKAERDKLRTHFDMAVEDGGMTDFEVLQSILRLLDQVDALEELDVVKEHYAKQREWKNRQSAAADDARAQELRLTCGGQSHREPTIAPARPHPRA